MRRAWGGTLVLVLLMSPACTDTEPTADGAAQAPTRTGEVVPVDACELVTRRAMRRALSEQVRIVGRQLEAPTLPTESCMWGREFGVALVELQVTPGPVADDTFRAAFGPPAGGEPRIVDVGELAYARTGLTSRTLQVLDNGVVLSIEAKDSPGDRLPRRALPQVAERVFAALPANPELADGRPPAPCAPVAEDGVSAAMTTDVRMVSGHVERGPDRAGALMCSWAGLPGNVVVTVRTDPVQITNYRANLSPRVYQQVPNVPAEVWSQNNRAGDLLIFLDDALLEVTTLPGQGFSSPDVTTTPGELELAEELVRTFAQEGPGR